jgi:hypothetical protein
VWACAQNHSTMTKLTSTVRAKTGIFGGFGALCFEFWLGATGSHAHGPCLTPVSFTNLRLVRAGQNSCSFDPASGSVTCNSGSSGGSATLPRIAQGSVVTIAWDNKKSQVTFTVNKAVSTIAWSPSQRDKLYV